MGFISKILASLGIDGFATANIFSSISKPEFLFSGILLVFLLLYGISLGRTRALMSLLGIYIAYVFNETFVFFNQLYSWIPVKNVHFVRIGLFILMYAVTYFILNRSVVKTRLTIKEASFISVFMISVLQMGLLLAIISNLLGSEILAIMPKFYITYFGTKLALFCWSLAPLIALVFMKGRD
jgi:hypothetical protein